VFLSTDAGGVGINLQAASAVINIEPPWNPARLEQRIARVHRMGQARPVLAIHLLTENSIEERVWETMRLKKELFENLFDGAGSEVSFEKLGRRSMIETLKEIAPDSDSPVSAPKIQKTDGKSNGFDGRDTAAPAPSNGADGTGQALAMLLEAGIKFIETISQSGRGESAEKPSDVAPSAENQSRSSDAAFGRIARNIEAAISPLIIKEPATDKAALHIPLPASLTSSRIAQTITSALARLMAG
jgi:superfamily II DNA/RNA helicase